MMDRKPTNKTYEISSFQQLLNVATVDNFEAFAIDFVSWMHLYVAYVSEIRKKDPKGTKDKTNWQIIRASFIWTDDGVNRLNSVQLEDPTTGERIIREF